ncbi:two-component system nitrogen regulation sensor histidine kinase GlnL [Paenochrobactrum gallinarii]|uniref:histidine kinase n=1 Tax=Paenochrobactrum gallinarii TaxID=643673 RepID=A0A841LNN1_9HYPH|nr:ATP-binding protein [Paenochrobactrum gallinarii]MBB6259595.1 two-component system nitrogen regulation sensor histidine kinase GlnL [Paenochrobactrum gallinarii]
MDTLPLSLLVLDSLNQAIIVLNEDNHIIYANLEAEVFFKTGAAMLRRQELGQLLPVSSPLIAMVEQSRARDVPCQEYRLDLSSPRLGDDKITDIYMRPVLEMPGHMLLVFKEKTLAEKIERQLSYRGAAQSVSGLASMLAHEIKNPLSGIRGAAQLLETVVEPSDQPLTVLIRDEADRIVKLVDRMEIFSDERPVEKEPVNIHNILSHVRALAVHGFGKSVNFIEDYDPSLPPVLANRDQLVQVVLNLVKNAAEAIGKRTDGEIILKSAYKPGLHFVRTEQLQKVSLPLEITVSDNGGGVANDMLPHLFDPFITGKVNGSGLGLALVAKIVREHGGVIECDSQNGRTIFRMLMPMWTGDTGQTDSSGSAR